MIKIENISKTYHLDETPVLALRHIALTIEAAQFVVVAGASGCGKSTLLNIIGSVEHPTSGTLRFDDMNVTQLSSDERADLRCRRIGFVFQNFNLLSTLTAYENVEYPLYLKKMAEADRKLRALSLLKEVGLEGVASHRPAQLSGGQRQRVAIARALANRPDLLLADEPTANLDRATGTDIILLLKNLNKKTGMTLLLATHDPDIMRQADRVVELVDGQVTKDHLCS